MHFFQIFTCGLKEQSLFRVFFRGEISQGNWRGGHMSRNICAKTQKTVTSLRWADAYVTWLFTTLRRGESRVDNLLGGDGEEKLRINSRINELCRLAVNHTFTWVGVICWVHLIPHSYSCVAVQAPIVPLLLITETITLFFAETQWHNSRCAPFAHKLLITAPEKGVRG